jgi:hypothetical protein
MTQVCFAGLAAALWASAAMSVANQAVITAIELATDWCRSLTAPHAKRWSANSCRQPSASTGSI